MLGRRAWQPDGAIALDFGTLPAALFRDLLPGGARHADLARLCAWYLGPDLDCRIGMACLPEHADCVLSEGCRLGQGAWLGKAGDSHTAAFTLAAPGAATHEDSA
ncbi:type VI secretion system baseplate subunit TssG [Massilia sp. Se16.2.3]|uniref:type VI secretion system baseplate subunit TssG n=1 Tax=Massilia sp. Se16.2.3 TaxID=2709303 RepID=UPI0035A7466B